MHHMLFQRATKPFSWIPVLQNGERNKQWLLGFVSALNLYTVLPHSSWNWINILE